jgi:septum formation inhibitor MinC
LIVHKTLHCLTVIQLEKKKQEYEFLREQRRRFDVEMERAEIELLGLQGKREDDDMDRLTNDITRLTTAGHQSEPTTPPEYRDNGFPSAFSRPNRFSSASMTSPSGPTTLSNRASRSGSQLTSPPADLIAAYPAQASSHLPSRSVPGSRRNSDEEDDGWEPDLTTFKPRTGAA